MSNKILFIFLSLLLLGNYIYGQEKENSQNLQQKSIFNQYFGAGKDFIPQKKLSKPQSDQISGYKVAGNYTTYSYTFADLLIFSYSDDTQLTVYNSYGQTIWSGTLNRDKYKFMSPGEGIYSIVSSKPFSLLIGDPISRSVLGYYAMDEQGKGVSRKFLTYMPKEDWGQERFVIHGYNNNTAVQVIDLNLNTTIWAGIINRGESFSSKTIQNQFVLVTSSEPVSVLSYTDQGYLIPAETGLWTGTHFYGYAGYVGQWSNDLNIISYENNCQVTVRQIDNGQIIWNGSINSGQSHNITLTSFQNQEVFFEITATKTICASVSPFLWSTYDYYHFLGCVDKTGKGIGNLFYTPAINGRIDFSSFEDGNQVIITNLKSGRIERTVTLNAGEHISHFTSNAIYKIEGSGKLAGGESYGGKYGGEFVPVYYGLELPDLTLTASSITFEPEHPGQGQPVTISAEITNLGNNQAALVEVGFYDGDPDVGGIQIGYIQTINQIVANGGTGYASVNWTTPQGAEYHQIYVKVDPNNKIDEANESNNKANKSLIPNEDLLPPLSVTIEAPSGLQIDDNGIYIPKPMPITVHTFNNGAGTAFSVFAALNLPAGLEFRSGETQKHSLGNLIAGNKISTTWYVEATGNPHGTLLYAVTVGADNAQSKDAKRTLYVPQPPFEADIMAGWQNICVGDANIYVDRGNGFVKVGSTGAVGQPVHVTNLSIGNKLKASKKIHTQPAVKDDHDEVNNTMFELWVDSDCINHDGSYRSIEITSPSNSYTLEMTHPIFKYNLTLSTESKDWSLGDYYDKLETGLKEASKLLFNATDGQAMFNKIAIYDKGVNKKNCDVLLYQTIERNSATTDGIDKNSWSSKMKIHHRQIYNKHWPNENDWYHSFIHEFGHYGFGLYDEYQDGDGKDFTWTAPDDMHPANYGLMQSHRKETEESSANDYLKEYPKNPPKNEITEQYEERKMPCWDWIKQKLEKYYSDVDLVLPPHGWYKDNVTPDRLKPDDDWIKDSTHIIDLRSTNSLLTSSAIIEPIESRIRINMGSNAVPAAHIYIIGKQEKIFLGKTTEDGYVEWLNTYFGSKILSYKIIGNKIVENIFKVENSSNEYLIELDQAVQKKLAKNMAGNDPGIVLDANVVYSGNFISLEFSLLSDITLSQTPQVIIQCGNVSTPIPFLKVGSTDQYKGSTNIDASAEDFDGTGYLDISIVDVNSNKISFTTYFNLFPVSNTELNRIFLRGMNLNVEEENISAQQLGVALASLTLPFNYLSQSLNPVTEMFTVKFEKDNSFVQAAGLNIYYEPSEAIGFDETSLGIYKWNESTKTWDLLADCEVDVEDNVVSALTKSTGIYCVFAKSKSSDNTPPGKIDDLKATTGIRHAEINLNWTAPGDDNQTGQATNYIIRFNTVPITRTTWEGSLDISYEPKPLIAGSSQSMSVKMPAANKLYYFAMKTEDENGNISELSNFVAAISGVQSYTFSLLFPVFNDTVKTLAPLFKWEKFEGDTSVVYSLCYSEDELFQMKEQFDGIKETEFQLTTSLKGNTFYYWKVYAVTSTYDTIECNQAYFRFKTHLITPSTGNKLNNNNIYIYPNPFNPDVEVGTIRFSLSTPGNITIKIYDVSNMLVKVLVDNVPKDPETEYAESWGGRNDRGDVVANGVYFYIIESSAGEKAIGKIAVLK